MDNLKTLEAEMLEARLAEIDARKEEMTIEIKSENADIDALFEEKERLKEERNAIKEELEARKAEAAEKAEARAAIAEGLAKVETIETIPTEERKVPNMEEVRNSKEYIEAYARYVRTEDDTECRALLTENVSGTVPVPEFVYDIVKTAWEREGITSRIRKSYLKGNLKVGFEISGDDAIIHTEGGDAISEENLVLGIVELVPQSIKKVVQISDEALDLRGEEFLRYIYDELTYRIAKKAADTIVAKIIACGTVSTTTCPSVPAIVSTTASLGLIASAMAQLSDEAANPVVIMNKLTYAAFKTAQYAANFAADPFEGLPVVFNNSIPALAVATTGVTWAIVGDLDHGALANFPNGEEITFKFDELSLKKKDLVEVLGREYVALGVVAPQAFCKITK